MKRLKYSRLFVFVFILVSMFINFPYLNKLILPFRNDFSSAGDPQRDIASNIPNVFASSTYFSIGVGGSDVIPHQIVRTNTDRLYIFVNQQSSALIRVYRTINAGLPQNASAFATPIQITLTSNPVSVDAVYDGGSIIHVLINAQNGQIKDYPFNVTTNTFNAPTTLAADGGLVASVLYVGTSGVAGMVDLNGNHLSNM